MKDGYKSTELGVLPIDWKVQSIESVLSEISMGPFGSDIKVSNFVAFGVPVLSGSNVRSERLLDSFTNFVTPEKAKDLKKAVAQRGDVVVTHRGTLGQISYIPADSEFDRYVISQSQFRTRFNLSAVLPNWIVLYFLSPLGSAKLLEGKGHTGVPALAQATTKFRQLRIPLPPLNEQRTIATTLTDVDALIAGLEKLIAKKRDLKHAAMQQLLTGQTRLPGFGGEWAVKRLGDLAEMGSGGTPPSANTAYYGGDIPWVAIADMTSGGKYIAATERNLTALGLANSAAQMFPVGTVLYAMYASLGECSIATVPVTTSQAILGIRPKPNLNSEFLYYVLISWKSMVKGLGQQGTQSNLNKGIVADFKISLPAFEEQESIAAVLIEMDSELAAIESRLAKTRELKQGMMQELLTGRTRLV